MSKAPKKSESSPVAEFEKALEALEQAVISMEKGDQSLDESLASYERGIALYRQCQLALEQAEQRVSLVNNNDPQQTTRFREDDAN